MRERFMLSAVLFLFTMSGCGEGRYCTKPMSYTLGGELETTLGSPILQQGCFAARHEPRGLNRVLWQKQAHDDNDFRSFIEKELLFAGAEDGKVRLIYREYSLEPREGGIVSYAKPVFFLDLEQDLKDTDTIIFREWELQVLKIEPGRIRYRVKKEPRVSAFEMN